MEDSFQGKINAENRKYPRMQLQLDVRFAPMRRGQLPEPVVSQVEDLGAGGMAMHCDQLLQKNQLVTVNLYLPPIDENHEPHKPADYKIEECDKVTILARVVWSKQDTSSGYLNGLAFYDVDTKNKKRLKHFLVDFELDSLLQG